MMSYNAGWELPTPLYNNDTGCVEWPESQWGAFESRLRRPSEEHGYFYVSDGEEFIGHVHYELDPAQRASIGLNVIPSRRGQGLSKSMLQLLLDEMWSKTAAVEAVNEFEDSRDAAAACHRAVGFVPDTNRNLDRPKPTRYWRIRRPETPWSM